MDSAILKVFSMLVATAIFFLLPLYVAYEKKDDISYSLALRATYEFTDEVLNKGYISLDMYSKYISALGATDNTYDIYMEHTKKEYYPTFVDSLGNVCDYLTYIKTFDGNRIDSDNDGKITNRDKIVTLQTRQSVTKVTLPFILESINRENNKSIFRMSRDEYLATPLYAFKIPSFSVILKEEYANFSTQNVYSPIYVLNTGDEFEVRIKNTNVTLATSLFNTMTLGASKNSLTRVYIEYGGSVKNEVYRNFTTD